MPLIVVSGYTVTITPNSVNPPSSYSGFTITQSPSGTNSIDNHAIINGPTIVWNTNSTCGNSGNGTGSFSAGSTSCKSNNCNVFLEGATGNCVGAYWLGPAGPYECKCTLVITGAGQSSIQLS